MINLQQLRPATLQEKGFTLIELITVIAIIGILAVIAIGYINPGKRIASAKDAGVKGDIQTISKALEAYYTSESEYPANLSALTTADEIKSVPTQQSGNVACPAASAGSALVVSGTAGNVGYSYCYYTVTVSSVVTSVALMGSLFNVSSNTWHCWDSTANKFVSRTTAPTVSSNELSC
jgi:prepilin-type N-terminal cleavage/methylation domain-containing protein